MTSAGFAKWPRDHVWFHSAPDPFLTESQCGERREKAVRLSEENDVDLFFLSEKIRDHPKS